MASDNEKAKTPVIDAVSDDESHALVVHETPTKGKNRRHRGATRKIFEESETDRTERLKGVSDNLTVTNIKSIIYNVVKDADVQKMLSNSLKEEGSKLEEATYEPKMTRAKMKQVLANEGKIPYPWPLSPHKTLKRRRKRHFTELEFPEDDDDEDYVPEKDLAELAGMSSDEDNESILSSHTSEVGSPMCSKSPQVVNSPSLNLPFIPARHVNLPQVCMGPPPPPEDSSPEYQQPFLDALDQLDLTDTVAKRTRSQQPLTYTSISSIEAELVPPDVTLDMYENPEEDEDPEWKDFLQNLLKDDVPADEDEDDPEADPEYNVLAEPEPEEDHLLPVRVNKSEINLLMEELNESEWLANDEDDYSQDVPTSFNTPKPLPIGKLTSVAELLAMKRANEVQQTDQTLPKPACEVEPTTDKQLPSMSLYERAQLLRQMQLYVQILCQQAMLAQVTAPALYQQSVQFLNELSIFASTSRSGVLSTFNVVNLQQALGLLASYHQDETKIAEDKMEVVEAKTNLTLQQKSALALSPVFMYPEILPEHPFQTAISHTRVKFHHAEDVLICMGLDEFQSKGSAAIDLLQKHMLTIHSSKSIRQHIHNECKKEKAHKTTIGRYKTRGLIPGSIRVARSVIQEMVIAPIDRKYHPLYPTWLKNITRKDLYMRANARALEAKQELPQAVAESVSGNSTSTAAVGVALAAEGVSAAGNAVTTATEVSAAVVVTSATKEVSAAAVGVTPAAVGVTPAAVGATPAAEEVSAAAIGVTLATVEVILGKAVNSTSVPISKEIATINNQVTPAAEGITPIHEEVIAADEIVTSNSELANPVVEVNNPFTNEIASADKITAVDKEFTFSPENVVTSPKGYATAPSIVENAQKECNTDVSFSLAVGQAVSESESSIIAPRQSVAQALKPHFNSEQEDRESKAPSSMLSILSSLSEAYVHDGESSNDCPNLASPSKLKTSVETPKKWRTLAPMPSLQKTPEKEYVPLDPNWKMRHRSPRHKELRSKVQAIVPKSFVPTVYVPSPTKKAAKAISEKALSRSSQISKYISPLKRKSVYSPVQASSELQPDNQSAAPVKRAKPKAKAAPPSNDNMFPSLLESSKSKIAKKHNHCASLATDIIEKDPQRVEREEKFSRCYINKVRVTLGKNSNEYNAFLEALIAFGKQKKNPAVFYGELRETVFKDQQELLQGFAAFLLPAQALACGERCYRDCIQFEKARRFLRRIEVYFGARSKLFLKLMKLLRRCDTSEPKEELRTIICSLLKRHTTLLEEFNQFFADAAPPERHEEDYEEMDLTEYDEETVIDEFEEMDVPEVPMSNATLECTCDCHDDTERQKSYQLRKKHCKDCMIAVVHRTLCLHAGPSQGLRPAYIRYINNKKAADTERTVNSDDDSKDSDIEAISPDARYPGTGEPSSARQAPDSVANMEQSTSTEYSWTRDEDKLILEAMQQSDSFSLNDQELFSLSTRLERRSAPEIKERLDTLMQVLCQQLSRDDSSDSTR
ncbi:GON-4-like protein [Watersipora subatra]|uniref:GON-4-like protein n=1 Tax=Watersipora subatra TaxID=2589382 RepID=UPI00355C3E10